MHIEQRHAYIYTYKYNKYDMYRFVLILAPKVYIISSVLYNFSFHIICMCVLICIYVSDRELMKSRLR